MSPNPTPKQQLHSVIDRIQMDGQDPPLLVLGFNRDGEPFQFATAGDMRQLLPLVYNLLGAMLFEPGGAPTEFPVPMPEPPQPKIIDPRTRLN